MDYSVPSGFHQRAQERIEKEEYDLPTHKETLGSFFSSVFLVSATGKLRLSTV